MTNETESILTDAEKEQAVKAARRNAAGRAVHSLRRDRDAGGHI